MVLFAGRVLFSYLLRWLILIVTWIESPRRQVLSIQAGMEWWGNCTLNASNAVSLARAPVRTEEGNGESHLVLLSSFLCFLAFSNVNSATLLRPPCQDRLDPLRVRDNISLWSFSCFVLCTVARAVTKISAVLGQRAHAYNLCIQEAETGDHEFKFSFNFLMRACLKIWKTKLLIFSRVD